MSGCKAMQAGRAAGKRPHPHEADAARAMSFKRAMQLCEWAAREFHRAGRVDAARAAEQAAQTAGGGGSQLEIPQEEIAGTTGHSD